jgi:hypothetical protein
VRVGQLSWPARFLSDKGEMLHFACVEILAGLGRKYFSFYFSPFGPVRLPTLAGPFHSSGKPSLHFACIEGALWLREEEDSSLNALGQWEPATHWSLSCLDYLHHGCFRLREEGSLVSLSSGQ